MAEKKKIFIAGEKAKKALTVPEIVERVGDMRPVKVPQDIVKPVEDARIQALEEKLKRYRDLLVFLRDDCLSGNQRVVDQINRAL